VFFKEEFNKDMQEDAIKIMVNEKRIGYINRGLLATFFDWMKSGRIIGAWIEKRNGTPEKQLYTFM